MTAVQSTATATSTPATDTGHPVSRTATTRALLACAVVGAPVWITVSLAQAATRAGFDPTRHPLSMLANGDLGWIQITNFVLAGTLAVAGAVGLRGALRGTPGGTWAPRLVGVHGVGMIAAGVFVMEPSDGFLGTPEGMPETLAWHSVGHMVAGSLTFTALIAACYVLGHHFTRSGEPAAALASRIAGTALLLGNGWAMTGGAFGSLTLAAGVITAMLWLSFTAARLHRGLLVSANIRVENTAP